MLKKGDKIPTKIKVFNEKKQLVSLKKYLNKPLVLYFYPRDNTFGCIAEAKIFRTLKRDFNDFGIQIIGVSKDSVESHLEFKRKHDLNFELLSDPEHKLQKAFGVWQEKRMLGRSYMSTVRSTFLIDKKGEIIKHWARVQPKDHPKVVLKFIQNNHLKDK